MYRSLEQLSRQRHCIDNYARRCHLHRHNVEVAAIVRPGRSPSFFCTGSHPPPPSPPPRAAEYKLSFGADWRVGIAACGFLLMSAGYLYDKVMFEGARLEEEQRRQERKERLQDERREARKEFYD